MQKYRTTKQFDEICESALNGNWHQAFKKCEEYGFYASDLIKERENSDYCQIKKTDLAILAEGAQALRNQNE